MYICVLVSLTQCAIECIHLSLKFTLSQHLVLIHRRRPVAVLDGEGAEAGFIPPIGRVALAGSDASLNDWMIFLRLNPNLIDSRIREVYTSAKKFFFKSVVCTCLLK